MRHNAYMLQFVKLAWHFTMKSLKPPVKSPRSLTAPRSSRASAPTFGQIRIIGGLWRGRKFQFPATNNLRPTPDRVREMLFNWLQNQLHDTRCLDLFCGSGALGLEALSRGAAHCTFVDSEIAAITAISQHLHTLQCTQATLIHAALPQGFTQIIPAYDVVFIDPPYADEILDHCLQALMTPQLLNNTAWVYIECSSTRAMPTLPHGFSLHRHKTTGQVQSVLLRWQADIQQPST